MKMKSYLNKKRSVTTKDVIRCLNENGVQVSESEAEEVIDFLYFLAELTVKQYFKDRKDGQNLP
jgi:hypothetical protein